jgi:hypothetical protein
MWGPLVDFDACSLIMAIPSVMLPTKDGAVLRTIGEAANYVLAPQGACRAPTSSARGNQ